MQAFWKVFEKEDDVLVIINADPDASREPRVAGMFINADAGLAMAGLAAGLSGGRQPWVSAARAAAIRDWAQAQIDAAVRRSRPRDSR